MARFLLYTALEKEGDGSAEFDTVDEVVEAVSELVRNTFGSGRRLITFSVGDMDATLREDEIHRQQEGS